jgi:carbohydrate-selective porin OprB
MVGLNWKDAFAKGNVLGMAVGQGTFVTSTYESDELGPWDGNYVWEGFYKIQVSDNIAVTPAIFYVSRPQGEYTGNGNSFDSFGYLIQTTFKF